MGNVSVTVKIYPEDPSKIEEIKVEIAKIGRLVDSKVEDVGFGIKALRVMFIVPDSEGGDMEERLNAIEGVSQVQVECVTLI
ncbi:MAG: elongation factor 1-beta [Candidatus Micrarchaeia archaeon]